MAVQKVECLNGTQFKRSLKRIPLCQEVDHLGNCVDSKRKLKFNTNLHEKSLVLRPYLKVKLKYSIDYFKEILKYSVYQQSNVSEASYIPNMLTEILYRKKK